MHPNDIRVSHNQKERAALRKEMVSRLRSLADKLEKDDFEIFLFYLDNETNRCVSNGFLSSGLGEAYSVVASLMELLLTGEYYGAIKQAQDQKPN